MQKYALFIILIIKLAFFGNYAHGSPIVVTSIKPLYNLTVAISNGVFTPILLAEDNVSEHDFQLKPSQITQIQNADLIFWVGPTLEVNLTKLIENLPSGKASRMLGLANLKLLPNRNLKEYELNEHHHHHEHGMYDPHIWLSIDNAIIMTNYIAHKLIVLDPSNKKIYEKNLHDFQNKLKQRRALWSAKTQEINNLPIVVMHDAYQYFNKLNIVGTIALDHDIPSSVKHLRQIKETLIKHKVQCICSEPQLNSTIAQTLTEDHKIKHVIVDPIGAIEDLGPEGYIQLIDKLTTSFYNCKNSD